MQTAGHGVFNFLQQLFSWQLVFFTSVWHTPLKARLLCWGHCTAGQVWRCWWGGFGERQPAGSAAVALQTVLHTGLSGVGLHAERLWNVLFPGAPNAKLKIVESVESKNDICEIH